MTQVLASLTALLALVLSLPAQAGSQVKEERKLSDFDQIRFDGSGTLEVVVGEDFRVVVESTEKALPAIMTQVEGGKLRIWREFGARRARLKVQITMPSVSSLELNGSVEVKVAGPIRTQDFTLRSAGSASAKVEDLEVEAFEVHLAGSGELEASGTAKTLELVTSGSAELRLADLEAESAKVMISGSGRAELHVTASLDATINGSGRIHLRGSPDQMRVHTNGSGRIIQKGD